MKASAVGLVTEGTRIPRGRRPEDSDPEREGLGAAAPRLATIAFRRLAGATASGDTGPEARWLRGLGEAEADPGASLDRAIEGWRSDPPPPDRRLGRLYDELDLTPVEGLAVALAFAAETDLMAGRALSWLQTPLTRTRPTVGLLVCLGELLGLAPEATLTTLVDGGGSRTGLLVVDVGDGTLVEATLRVPPPLVSALGGGRGRWAGVATRAPRVELAPSVVAEAEARGAVLEGSLVIRSGDRGEARSVCAGLCAARGQRPAFVELEPLLAGRLTGLGPWLRLERRIPVVCGQVTPGEAKALADIPGYDGPVLVATTLEGLWHRDGVGLESWTIPVPPRGERVELWTEAGVGSAAAAELGCVHRIGAARIGRLVAQARRAGSDAAPPGVRDVARVARRVEPGGLGALAEPLAEDIEDDALVLSPALRSELEALEDRCRARDGLADGLGPAARARYRPGVRALMVGPSGTGKTLACGWLATRLGLPLYRVDLAAVSSKYIGETEKNLGELFARAEHAGVVLMFDEADALFGKRTDVRDAHDRYANQQTNYLLQRIESFDGIVLLTSNSRARFDSAFARRLDVVIEFPPPQPAERRALWRAHVGASSGLTSAQLNRLAAGCELAGGHIRNVVLAARARSPDRPLDWESLSLALAAEYRKLGKPLPAGLASRADPR